MDLRFELSKAAVRQLEARRSRIPNYSLSVKRQRFEEEPLDVLSLANSILLGTKLVLVGSDLPRDWATVDSYFLLQTSNQGNLSTALKKKKAGGISKLCKVTGCMQPLALTSSSYCRDHVGSGALCSVTGCSRAAEGDGYSTCRLHTLEFLETNRGLGASMFSREEVQKFGKLNKTDNSKTKTNSARSSNRQCNFDTCEKSSRGSTYFCIQHGGGKR